MRPRWSSTNLKGALLGALCLVACAHGGHAQEVEDRREHVHDAPADAELAMLVDGIFAGESGFDELVGQQERADVDPARFRQAVGNLVDNGLRHTPPGGQVTVEVSGGQSTLAITVRDTGSAAACLL